MNRRQFLQKTGLAASTLAAFPLIAKSQTLGRGNSVAANSRIGIALIGNGQIMEGHREYYLSSPLTEVRAVSDVDEGRMETAKMRVEKMTGSECTASVDFEPLLQRDDIDAVVIGTPDHWHAAIAIAAMQYGKDVYVEKPMTLTIEESKAVVAAQEQYGQILQVGSQQRSNWHFRRAAEIVRNGWIGDIKEVRVKLGSFEPPFLKAPETIPEGFHYDKWLGPTPFEPYFKERAEGDYGGGWRRFWDYGSRKNGDWGAHHFDIIQWAFDQDQSGPTFFMPKGFQGEPYQYHQYANGIKILRDHPDRNGHMIRFVGTKGDVMVSRTGIATNPPELASKPLRSTDRRLYHSDNHRLNWLNCIQSRQTPICDAHIGHRSGTICLLAGIAERLERPIHWDPKAEDIVDDAVARRMMDRPRRAGYGLPLRANV